MLVAIDCIIFGFDGKDLKLLLIKRGFSPHKGRWSLVGGFVGQKETPEQAASRVLEELTGLPEVYLEQLHTFGAIKRDSAERTISIAFFSLIDINKYTHNLSSSHQAEWFLLDKIPKLIFDHQEMIDLAIHKLRYKAALHPILFELLPPKFTIPQLQQLYEAVYQTELDNRNFSRKLLSTKTITKLNEKDKAHSKKGAYYFKYNGVIKNHYADFVNLVPNPERFL